MLIITQPGGPKTVPIKLTTSTTAFPSWDLSEGPSFAVGIGKMVKIANMRGECYVKESS
jgi:hypothetical protein